MREHRSSLDPLLCPKSVAVVGASRQRGSIGSEVFHNLLASGFTGAVYPVNPRVGVVQSVRAYATVEEIPDPVDLAVLSVPAAHVLAAMESCGRKGVRAVVVLSAGFAETGGEGIARQDELVACAERYGMRMVGPNCLGVLNADPAYSLNATFAPVFPPFGKIAFLSQSGALGLAALEHAKEHGVGVSSFVSVGNKADVSTEEMLAYWSHDPSTAVVLLYLENLGEPRRFLELARVVSRRKPVLMVKSGRTEAGARAASSHTGSLAGLDVAVDALLGQAGVVRADTIDELFDAALLLASQPVPKGKRVAILTNAGGPGILGSDACESRHLEVRMLDAATRDTLQTFLPKEASVRNPVDMIASATAEQYEQSLRCLLADPSVDAVLVLFVPPVVTKAQDVAESILRASAGATKPVLTCFMGRQGIPEAVQLLRAASLPCYAFPESAARALALAARYGAWLDAPDGVEPALDRVDEAQARYAIAKHGIPSHGRWLHPEEARDVLAAYGIEMPAAREARTLEEAVDAGKSLGFPVVLKLLSDTITHKTDVGGVFLDLRDEDGVVRAWRTLQERLERAGLRSEMRGALIQKLVRGGIETFVGATRDPTFGHLVGFGLGGIHIEVWKDVLFRVAPLRDTDADAMLTQVRGRVLLEGFRGGPVADRASLRDVLLRVSRLVRDLPELSEIDLNPVLALPTGVLVLDARLRVALPHPHGAREMLAPSP